MAKKSTKRFIITEQRKLIENLCDTINKQAQIIEHLKYVKEINK